MPIREIAIQLYLAMYWCVYTACTLFPVRDKVVLVETIGQHSPFIIDEMMHTRPNIPVVLLKQGGQANGYRNAAGELAEGPTVIPFGTKNIIYFIRSVYHVATSRFVLIDNYHAFLSVIRFRPGVECLQLWHAVGGFKRTGLKDRHTDERSNAAKQRFQKVYGQFTKLPVGSRALAQIHMDAFGLPEQRMLPIGIPRTDLFFNDQTKLQVMDRITSENPVLQRRKVLLYAPTYRDGELEHFRLHLDLERMQREFGQEFVLLLRLHPAIRSHDDYEAEYPGFVFDYSSYPSINELLLVTDCLITDYSSVICEYALLKRPMVFYLYDLDEYLSERGLWEGYESRLPGPVARTMDELVGALKSWEFDVNRVISFSKIWHEYSNGHSSQNLIDYMVHKMSTSQVRVDSASES